MATFRQPFNSFIQLISCILCGAGLHRPNASSYSPRTRSSFLRRSAHAILPRKPLMCVAIRSRNQRSCEITTAQPAKSSKPSSSARRVFTSISLVGSSSNRTLPSSFNAIARCKRLRSPPDRMPHFFSWSDHGKVETRYVSTGVHLAASPKRSDQHLRK